MQERIRFSHQARDSASLSQDNFWKKFCQVIPAQVIPAGSALFKQGSLAQDIFLIDSGIVKLVCSNENGKETIVGLRSRGSVLGAAAITLDKPLAASAITLNNSAARRLPAAGFIHLARTDPELAWRCFQSQSAEHYQQVDYIARLGNFTAGRRLEHLILQLIDLLEVRIDQKRLRFRLPLTYEEMGALIGVDPTYVCKLMGRLEREGKLKRDRGWLIITDSQKLFTNHE